jgi:hypothetical protein
MKLWTKGPTFLLLFAIAALNCYGQEIPKKNNRDTTVPKAVLGDFKQTIYFLREKVKLQQYELGVLKELGKVDSSSYGQDSLVTLFTSRAGKPLKRITEKKRGLLNNYEDSNVVYYNKNGLIEYTEMWQIEGKKKLRKMKLTCRRYEYDDQNRVTRCVINFPAPATEEFLFTYDSSGNVTRTDRKIDPFTFWDEIKKTSPK